MLLRLTTLGAARVYGGDVEFPDLPAQRLRFALLLYLALERDISREEVLAMFWPERDAARGKHALRQMLYELRQVLGEDWIELRRDRILVRASVDATEFEDAVTGGRVEDALRVYGGAFLLGFSLDNRSFEGWADRRRAHLARLHRRLQRENVAALAAAGSTDAALAAARRWVELDPVDDEAAHTLIERLAAAGQRTAALQYYDNYERQLAAELDVEPLEATRALVASIRAGEPVSGAHNVQPAGEGIVSEDGAAPSAPAPAAATTSTSVTTAASTVSALVSISHPVTAAAPAPASPVRRTLPARWADALLNRRTGVTVAIVTPVLLLFALVARPGTDRSLAELPPARIAVLPFADHSAEASLVPLSNALTETLAHSLAASRFLDIISPNGVLLLRSQGAAEDSLGRLLGADYLVGGSISRGEDWVRVDVELLDGRTGSVVRTEVVQRPWTESRILVDDVVRRAATFLRREVGAQVEVRRVRAHTRSEDAWRLVLEAKSIRGGVLDLIMAGQLTTAQEQLATADSLLAAAARLDRKWAEPVLLRGWNLQNRAFITRASGSSNAELRQRLLEAGLGMADEAAARDPKLAGIYELRGTLLHQLALQPGTPVDSVRGGLAIAEAELRRAVELDPQSQSAWRRLADVLLHGTERYGEAKQAAERAYRLDPYAAEANTLIYLLFTASLEIGQDDQAEGWCLEGRRRFPSEPPFLYCLMALHAWADAIQPDPPLLQRAMRSFQVAQEQIQPQMIARFEAMLAAAYARAGQPDSARAVLRRLEDVAGDPGLLWLRAAGYAALHEDSIATDLLEQYIARGGWGGQRVAKTRPFRHLRERAATRRVVNGESGRTLR